ncbi:VCBS repeat-containing protein [Singulisphaera sp. GP187]|uniref:Ig-like domain-containing protein n=1 Tax=Singulisphaera sp. GP187 TaxID=1882752 RepID=UPI00092603E9|nr:Ig-like domain-containing protein [Singulisphaera sp. GP187]SIN79230.1 VCBS repeat-containing protein [Singulisphaera sp. GP187]
MFNDTDPDNHPLTAVLVTSTQHGTLTLGADGSFTYIPAANYVGTDAFTYKVTNGTATSVPAIVTIQVIEQVPTPVIDGYTVGHDRTLALPADSGGVLGNDTDADGDGLSAVLVTSTQHGTLTLDASGTFTYTPATGYVGTDTFTYRPSDGLLVGDVTAVTIVVTEQAPVARSDRYSLPRDHTLDATYRGVLLNDTDADGDTLTATLVATTQHGTLAFSANGSFTYTPASGYAGTDTFSYTVSDGLQATAATTVTITVTDLPPTVQNLSYTIPPDRPLGLTADKGLLARATDPYGYQLTAALVSSPSHGTLTLNADGSFTYTPAAGFTGSDTFTYTVSDSLNASAPATVSFYVVDEPPYAGYGGDGFAVKPGETLTTTAANGVLSFASDPYGYEMTATLVTNPAHGTLTLNPDGSFTYTPAAGFTGNDSFSYTVSDGLNTSDPTSTWINVSEDAWGGDSGGGGGTEPADTKPQAGSDGYEIAPGQTLLTPIGQGVLGNDSDPGGLTLTATLVQTTQHGTLVLHADGLFSYSPDPTYVGDDHFTYQAGNGTDASQTTTVTITVTPHAPGGLLAGGVGFHGTGQTASVGYGAVTSTGNPWDSEEENNGDPDGGISDNFAPTFSGPGLEGPGQYAAEFHGTGSQAASYFGSNNVVPTQASFRGGSYGLGGYSSWGGFGWGYGWGGYYGFGYGLGYGFGGWGGYGYGYGYDYGWGWGGWGWWGNPSGSYSYDDGNGNSTTWTWSYSWGSGGWSGSESLTNTVSTDTVEGHSSSSWNWSSDGSSSSYDAQSEGSFSVDSHTSSSSAIGSDDFEQHSTSSWSSHYQSQASYNYEDGTSSHSGSSDSHYESFASYIQTHTQSTQQGSGSYTRTGQTSRTDDSNSSGSGGSDNQGHWNDTWDSTSSSTGSSVYSDDNSGERSLSAGGTETYATNQWSNDQYSRSNSDNGSTSDGITNRTTAATAKSGGERGGASSSTRKGVPFGSSYDWGQNAQYVDGTEDVTQSSGWSYHYTDRSSSGSQTSSNVTTSSSGTTHSDYGDDVSITDIRGTDLFGATTVDEWTGRNSQYDGSEKYHVHKEYSDRYNNKSSSSSTNDGQGGSTSQSHNEHTDQGEEGWSANVQGKLTFSMTATDPNTGDTIWDIGIENYVQDQAIAATFANKNSTDSSSTNGSGSYSNDSSQTSGGSDSQSRGDQISHRYGSTSENPMTGDISNLGGSGTSNLRVSYRDSYTNRRTSNATEEGSSSSSTHTDEGEGKASYVSRGTETTSTMLTDPLTGDFSSDRATRNFTENDRSTESFTNESSAATSTDSNYETDSSVSSSHTDSGSNTTNSCNQYANLTLFMLGNGQETNVDSGNSDHKETSNNEFSDETSETVTKHNAEVVSVTRSASHSDSGSDSSSFHDQWTSQLSTVSKYGLATETISDFYNRLDLFTNQHDNNSSNDEVISDGEIVSATTTTRHSDSGSNSSSSSEQGTKSSSASSSDGSSLNSSTRTFTEEKTSSGQSDNQSATETVLAHGEMVSASRSISSSDSGLSDTSHHEQTTGIVATPTFALTLNTAWDSSSSDQYDDQSQQVDSDQDGMTSSASTESHSVSKIESSSATENGSFEFSSPTDNGTENVSGVFTINEISNGTWIETSQYESNDDDGVVTGSMTTSLDQTGSDTFNQSIQGSYTFAGISAGENNHAGSGSFVQSGGTTSSFALHDLSSMTIDSTGVLSGTDVSTLDKNENWTNSRQDTVELETDGAGTDQVCLNTQDSGTLTSHEMDSMAGTTDDFQEHVSTTVLMSDTGTLSGSDSGSNFEVTTADDSSLTTVVSDPADGSDSATFSGGPMTTQSGTLTPGLAVAFQAAPLQNGMQAVFGALGITGGPPHLRS